MASRQPVPAWSYFIGSAVFHYLGPAFAVLLFARIAPLGVAGLRIWTAAVVFALWRRPWRLYHFYGRSPLLGTWAVVLAAMNACFYLAIARLPLGTVAAIEFLPVIAVAALGARSVRNAFALAAAVIGVCMLTDVRLEGAPLGFVFAFLNAALFAVYIVLAHRVSQLHGMNGPDGKGGMNGLDGLAAAMVLAAAIITPIGLWQGGHAIADPVSLAAGAGVGITSSVIPYVCDQLAMARMRRSTYALMVALLPATATVIGVLVLRQLPSLAEAFGVALVVLAVLVHSERPSEHNHTQDDPPHCRCAGRLEGGVPDSAPTTDAVAQTAPRLAGDRSGVMGT